MTKDLKNKFTTFIILMFASVLLLVVSLFSDYRGPSGKQMDKDAVNVAKMDDENSKQAFIVTQMDTIDRKLRAFKPTANDAVVLSNEIDKGIKALKDYFVKNDLKESAYTGIIDNYTQMLLDKQSMKSISDNNDLAIKKLADCKEKLIANKSDLKDEDLIQRMGSKKE